MAILIQTKLDNAVMSLYTSFPLTKILYGSRPGANPFIIQNVQQDLREFSCLDPGCRSSTAVESDSKPFNPRCTVIGIEPLWKHDLRSTDPKNIIRALEVSST